MLRAAIAVVVSGSLQVGALSAPLVHAHLDDHHDDHHAAQKVHAHVESHGVDHASEVHHTPGSAPAVHAEEDAEQVTRLPLFLAVHAEELVDAGLALSPFVLPPAPSSVMRRPPEVVRSHGPPDGNRADSRGPPTPSVLI